MTQFNGTGQGQLAQATLEQATDRWTADLDGAIALVTGGGRGLGQAICQTLGEAGATIIAADIRNDLVQSSVNQLLARGRSAEALMLDVGDQQQTADAVSHVLSKWKRLDILVNNAATDVTLPIDELSVEQWDQVLRTNLRGPFLLARQAFMAMKRQGGGQIVNIASTASKRAWPNASAYHASKWGLLGLSHALHAEGRPHNIKVTAIISGGMRTPFLLDRFPDIDAQNLQDALNVARTVRFVLTQPDETVIPEIMVLPMRETSWP